MKGLILNHGSEYIDPLKILFKEWADVINYAELTEDLVSEYDFIVLSGGPGDVESSIKGEEVFFLEKSFLRKINIPIFGICLGHQMIASAFGAKQSYLNERNKGFRKLALNGEKFEVFYNHKNYFEELPKEFVILAKEGKIINAFRHKEKAILAVQCHPEMSKEDGIRIRDLFLKHFVKSDSFNNLY